MSSTDTGQAGLSNDPVCNLLQASLYNSIDFAAQLKQSHWTIRGTNFIALHELFDQMHGDVGTHVDDLAERIMMLGGHADGTIEGANAHSTLPKYAAGMTESAAHLKAITASLDKLVSDAHASIDDISNRDDPGTEDLFTQIIRDLQKMRWFIRSHMV